MKKKLQNDSDIVGFMVKIQEQLAVLDQKLDTFMTKSLTELAQAMSAPKPSSGPHIQATAPGSARQPDNRHGRPMFRATCSDCKKECEIPFKPSGDRPVYCKECFARRKAGNAVKTTIVPRPQEAPVVQAVNTSAIKLSAPLVKVKRKPAAAKVAKKKVAVKKKAKKKK